MEIKQRSKAYLGDRQYTRALTDLDEALQHKPKYKAALVARAKLNKLLGNCIEAQTDLTFLLELKPSHKEGKELLPDVTSCVQMVKAADYEISRNRYQQAKSYLDKAMEVSSRQSATIILVQLSSLWFACGSPKILFHRELALSLNVTLLSLSVFVIPLGTIVGLNVGWFS